MSLTKNRKGKQHEAESGIEAVGASDQGLREESASEGRLRGSVPQAWIDEEVIVMKVF